MLNGLSEILVATDLSRASRHAEPWAAGIARAFGARVTLLHVDEVSPVLPDTEESATYLAELGARREALLVEAERRFVAWDLEVRVESRVGVASQQILELATRQQAGLVVVSKSGGRVLEPLLFGSTTRRVLRATRLPLLVVHQPPARESALKQPVSFQRLMMATDLGPTSARAFELSVALARRLGAAELLLDHVVRTPLAGSDHGVPLPAAALEPARRDAKRALALLAEADARVLPRVAVGGAVAQTLAEIANVERVDLAVLPSRGRSPAGDYIGHTAEAVLRRIERPALVLPWQYLHALG